MMLLPQIPKFAAEDLAARLGQMSITDARSARGVDHPLKIFSPTGGTHCSERMLEQMRDALEVIARRHGYPGNRPTDLATFDRETAEHLHRSLKVTFNEASKPGPWQFIACVVMPDLVVWRQRRGEGAVVNSDNFLDSTNNLFRRLWWRAAIFNDPYRTFDPLWLLDHLLEDAIQTFYERRSLSGTPRLGLVFGRVYHATAQALPSKYNMEPVERTAQKWLVRIGENIAYETLSDLDLVHVMAEAFHRSVPAIYSEVVSIARLTEQARFPEAFILPTVPPGFIVPIVGEPVVEKGPSSPSTAAVVFDERINRAFSADRGTYSTVTNREADASEINLTGPEAKIAEDFFGRERLHVGPVRSNPDAARQRFRMYPNGELIYLNLVYPKHERTELRLYLSNQKGFKPSGGSIWFLFQRKRDLFIGFMSNDDWLKHLDLT
jgi:hypothetical protein